MESISGYSFPWAPGEGCPECQSEPLGFWGYRCTPISSTGWYQPFILSVSPATISFPRQHNSPPSPGAPSTLNPQRLPLLPHACPRLSILPIFLVPPLGCHLCHHHPESSTVSHKSKIGPWFAQLLWSTLHTAVATVTSEVTEGHGVFVFTVPSKVSNLKHP